MVLRCIVDVGWPQSAASAVRGWFDELRPADTVMRSAQSDARYHPSAAVRRQLSKVFPTHCRILLGEIALYSFVVLLITGIYLTLFFDPSMTEVAYHGVYQPLRGVQMSRAYESALSISFEVRGGLFVRQVHHWAALLFAASIMVHLARVFFTGAFRRPREANWVIGTLLLILAMFEGYFGYSLPDDLLSGIGLHAALSSIMLGFPLIGTWCMGPVRRRLSRHHADPPALRAPRAGVAGNPAGPDRRTPGDGVSSETHPVSRRRSHRRQCRRCARDAGLRRQVRRLLRADRRCSGPDGRTATINPIWSLGPYSPSQVSAGSQPDFYMMWPDGLQRLWPAWEISTATTRCPRRSASQ